MSIKREIQKISILLIVAVVGGCSVPRDRTDAAAIALRVHSQMKVSDFAAIYRESANRFKGVGSESQFILMMQQMDQEIGVLKKADEVAYQTGLDSNIGRTHVLFFNLEYEHGHAKERMILTRSDKGEMQLWKLEIDPAN
jgi:hypothetical protein